MTEPRHLTAHDSRARARETRDAQWRFMERVAKHGTLWCCWWNKNRRHDSRTAPPDLLVCGLISGMEYLEWIARHPDWWSVGEWSDARYAVPVSLTAAGHTALAERERYDMEPVFGGLVEPGWQAIPLTKDEHHRGLQVAEVQP